MELDPMPARLMTLARLLKIIVQGARLKIPGLLADRWAPAGAAAPSTEEDGSLPCPPHPLLPDRRFIWVPLAVGTVGKPEGPCSGLASLLEKPTSLPSSIPFTISFSLPTPLVASWSVPV